MCGRQSRCVLREMDKRVKPMTNLQNLPRISVVMPNFNGAKYIEQAIESVLSQDYPNLEFIVTDGGSSDASVQIIKKHEGRLTYWHSRRDRGQSDAINQGLARAQGDVLTYLNSDDGYVPGALKLVGSYFATQPACDILYGRTIPIDGTGAVVALMRDVSNGLLERGFRKRTLLWWYNYIPQPATFWRRRVFDSVGGMDENLHLGMDYDYWLRVLRAGFRFDYVPHDLAMFRYHPMSKTLTAKGRDRLQELRTICAKADAPFMTHWVYEMWGGWVLGRYHHWRSIRKREGLAGLLSYLGARFRTRVKNAGLPQ